MAYSKDGIMAQVYMAFGQGTGEIRVSQDVCDALKARYYDKITSELIENWDKEAVQVLERIRAIGRLMATEAKIAGSTHIRGEDALHAAAKKVEVGSDTMICRDPP